jgi:RimJ/RimL family protein N-acetyltransferase
MENNLFRGKLVRLTAEDPQTFAEADSRWSRDSEYWRLLDCDPSYPRSARLVKERIEKNLAQDQPEFLHFMIRKLEDNRVIGEIGLDGISWTHREAFVGIGIGERDQWGKGYGTDAMRLILRFGFSEMNLMRISLDVFEYNLRAIRSYEKIGFVHEGRLRGALRRDGSRYDMLYMGITREEWRAMSEREQGENRMVPQPARAESITVESLELTG